MPVGLLVAEWDSGALARDERPSGQEEQKDLIALPEAKSRTGGSIHAAKRSDSEPDHSET